MAVSSRGEPKKKNPRNLSLGLRPIGLRGRIGGIVAFSRAEVNVVMRGNCKKLCFMGVGLRAKCMLMPPCAPHQPLARLLSPRNDWTAMRMVR